MVLVPDVLRQLQSFVNPFVPADRQLCHLIKDFQFGLCQLYHPSTPVITSFADLPGLEAEGLFVAEYNPATKKYEGTFRWLSRRDTGLADCLAFQQHLNRYMALPGWSGAIKNTTRLPLPKSATIGGLLVCRNVDVPVIIGIMPTDLAPAVTLVHIVLALTTILTELINQPEAIAMKTVFPMLDTAEQHILRSGRPPRVLMLHACLDMIRKRELEVAGGGPGEDEAFFSPDNQLELVFILAAQAYRDFGVDPVRYWVEYIDLESPPIRPHRVLDQRFGRFLKRRQAIMSDDKLQDPNEYVIGRGVVHAAWVITRHPHDGLSTRLLIQRAMSLTTGLTILQNAIHAEYLGARPGR